MIQMINGKRLSLLAVSVILLIIYSSFTFSEQENSVINEENLRIDSSVYDVESIIALPEKIKEKEKEVAFSKDDWNLILVNKQHPLSPDFPVELGVLSGTMECDKRIIEDWYAMKEAAAEDGVTIIVASPYRDYERQVYLFDKKVKTYMSCGMNYLEAYKNASQLVNIPGCSEHQTGLALDIISDDYSKLNEGFAGTDAGKWLAENCQDYGFILRYPKGKEYVTSIDYEPWHFRYVGEDAASIIMEEGITLEEFIERLG
ncbi:MAG: M15 family metallopeptidase [Lachnospiraceae bacterium]|nr:M15 family metallopeptidase [Lachnospiraceae bacterium]